MKKVILIFISLSLVNSVEAQWFPLTSIPLSRFNCVDFVNLNTGWAITPLSIMKSTNGGINWITQASYGSGIYPHWMYILDENYGWVVCQAGVNIRTTNGGLNWIVGSYSDSTDFENVYFVNSQTGWAAGWGLTDKKVVKTTNGGINWFPQVIDFSNEYWAINFINVMTGWVAGYYGRVLKTTDSGQNWVLQATGTNKNLYAIFFISSTTGWFGGLYGTLYKTTNGGTNWVAQNTGSSLYHIYWIRFLDSQKGWAVGDDNRIIATTNGGSNWYQQYIGTYQDALFSLDLIPPQTCWASGEGSSGNGIILKTTNGGGPIGIGSISTEIPKNFSLSQNYPNPFNPTTKIKFSIPLSRGVSEGRGVFTQLIIHDILGREIATLVNQQLKPGIYEVQWDGSNHPSGVYFYKLTSVGYTETRKMVLEK